MPNAIVHVDSVDLFKSKLDNFWMSLQDVLKYDYTVNLAGTGDLSMTLNSCSSVSRMIRT